MIRRDLSEKLAQIWLRLDRDRDDFAQRFLSVFQQAIDEAEARAKGVLDLKAVDRTPDQYLRLLADHVGYRWKTTRSYQRNRRDTKRSVPRYSYKGTIVSIDDLAQEHATTINGYQDNASLLLVLNKQGHLSHRDCALVAADYWHDGAFVWTVDRAGDPDGFIDELATLRPVGERWYHDFITVLAGLCEVDVTAYVTGTYSYANTQYGRLNSGTLGDDVLLSYEPVGGVEFSVTQIAWMDIELDDRKWGRLGVDCGIHPYDGFARGLADFSVKPIVWMDIELDDRKWGRLSLDCGLYPYNGMEGKEFAPTVVERFYHDIESDDIESFIDIAYESAWTACDGGDVSTGAGMLIDGLDYPWEGQDVIYDGGDIYVEN